MLPDVVLDIIMTYVAEFELLPWIEKNAFLRKNAYWFSSIQS